MVQGKREGPWEEYFPEGQVKSQGTYRQGLKEGAWVSVWRRGEAFFRSEGSYTSGEKDGEHIGYHPDGRTIKTKTSYVEGKAHGEHVSYHENGVVESQGAYLHGKKEGPWVEVEWRKSTLMEELQAGQIRMQWFARVEVSYVKGEREGESVRYHEKRFGEQETYDREEPVRERSFFVNGVLHGVSSLYSKSGAVESQRSYVHGELQPYLGSPAQGDNHLIVMVGGFSEVVVHKCCSTLEDAQESLHQLVAEAYGDSWEALKAAYDAGEFEGQLHMEGDTVYGGGSDWFHRVNPSLDAVLLATVMKVEWDPSQGQVYGLLHWRGDLIENDVPEVPYEFRWEPIGAKKEAALIAFQAKVAEMSGIPWADWVYYESSFWDEDEGGTWAARADEIDLEDTYWLKEESFMMQMWEACDWCTLKPQQGVGLVVL